MKQEDKEGIHALLTVLVFIVTLYGPLLIISPYKDIMSIDQKMNYFVALMAFMSLSTILMGLGGWAYIHRLDEGAE